MYQTINEPIEVLVGFYPGKVKPIIFRWRGSEYRVGGLHLVHESRDGTEKIVYFNVTDAANYFKLSFSTRHLSWKIEELYNNG